ncbi:MAG TPA: hypothetical protein VHP14_26515 [Anaerolineales bacterium]|nr:hypothetical protein [Anaerolineales bacterium]
MASEYQQTMEKEIQDRVRSKYSTAIAQLKAFHFEELCFMEESLPALGMSNGFFGLFGVLAALPFEVSRVGRNLRASIFSVLMVSRECDTYAAPSGLGLKFYTSFTDGTCVITGNFNSQPINNDREKLYKFAQSSSIEQAWQYHQNRINGLVAKGKQRKYQLSFDDCAKLMRREDDYMLKSMPFASFGAVDFGSMFLSVIIFLCLLIAAALVFASLPIIVSHAYPACVSVKDLSQFSLLRSFLAVPVCVAFSWLLARVQKNAFALDAIGTELHGNIPSPKGSGYIATKWLVFMFLPILPVRSYQIDGEYSKSFHPNSASMHPLPELHWTQIRETIRHFRLGYFLAVAFWLGLGVWALTKCV